MKLHNIILKAVKSPRKSREGHQSNIIAYAYTYTKIYILFDVLDLNESAKIANVLITYGIQKNCKEDNSVMNL